MHIEIKPNTKIPDLVNTDSALKAREFLSGQSMDFLTQNLRILAEKHSETLNSRTTDILSFEKELQELMIGIPVSINVNINSDVTQEELILINPKAPFWLGWQHIGFKVVESLKWDRSPKSKTFRIMYQREIHYHYMNSDGEFSVGPTLGPEVFNGVVQLKPLMETSVPVRYEGWTYLDLLKNELIKTLSAPPDKKKADNFFLREGAPF